MVLSGNSDILIVHQNIRRLRKNFDVLVVNIDTYKERPSFIFLSEIWVNTNELSSYNIDGYTLHSSCNDSYRSGGVCVFVESRLSCSVIAYNLASADIIRVDWSFANDNFVILGVYRLHVTPLNIFLQEITEFVSNITAKNLLIVGDMNIDILNFPTDCDDYMFIMSSFGLESMINVPTRVTSTSATCIDHLFARLRSNDLSCLKSSAIDLRISDHHLIELVFKFNTTLPQKKQNCFSNKTKLNVDLLNELLEEADWNHILNLVDPSEALDQFYFTLTSLLNQCYTCVHVNNVRLLKPWISYKLASQIKSRYLMYNKLKKRPNDKNLRETYENSCKFINSEVKREKEMYYLKKFSSNGNDSKKNWKLVNELLTKKAKTSIIESIVSDNGDILTSDIDIANEFCVYFTSIAESLKAKILSINSTINDDDIRYDICSKTFFMTPVSTYEVSCIIESLEPKESLDYEGISNYILKNISRFVSPVLAHIFNLSFEKGVVPPRLKSAEVIPIFKNGDRHNLGNYRPIALQPVLLKVLEKAVKNRVLLFLDRFSLLSPHQHGFRQGLSTESAMLQFLDAIHNGLNSGEMCAGLFIDASKAFDMVDHKMLLSILFKIGFRGISNNWFRSYLENRTVRVRVNDCFSDFKTINIGVPQGSVLGPLLFLIYTNSIFKLNLYGNITGFADDLALAYTGNSSTEVVTLMNADLKILHKWFDKHCFILSDKTKYMWFKISGMQAVPDNSKIIYHNDLKCSTACCQNNSCLNIEPVNSFKYLGIYFDTNLNWKIHISKLKSYIASASRIFYLLRSYCPVSVLKMAYHALVLAKLEYGLSCWGGCYPTTLKPLNVLQNMILRTIFRKKRFEPSWPLFLSLNILPLQHLYVYKVLRIFFKRSGQHVLRSDLRFNFRSNLRLLYKIPKFNFDHFRRYILVAAPTFFNALPDNIRRQIHSKSFLPSVKAWLFETSDITHLFRVVI